MGLAMTAGGVGLSLRFTARLPRPFGPRNDRFILKCTLSMRDAYVKSLDSRMDIGLQAAPSPAPSPALRAREGVDTAYLRGRETRSVMSREEGEGVNV